MADPPDGLLGRLFPGNDPAALYGGALTDPATQAQMAQRGLLAMAGSFADSAMPTRMPTPLGAVLGHAAAAMGTSGDAVMAARLQAAQAQQASAQAQFTQARSGLIGRIGTEQDSYDKIDGSAPIGPGGVPLPGTLGAPNPAAASVDTGRGPVGVTIPPGTPTAMMDPKLSGSANLNNLIQAAAPIALPDGYTVEMSSGARPGAVVGGGGGASQHATGEAADFVIKGPDGKKIDDRGTDPTATALYSKLALTARGILDPSLKPWLAWGGNFDTAKGSGVPDLMHFDWAGDRGHRGTLAQMEQQFAAAQKAPPGTQLAQANTGTMTDAAAPQPGLLNAPPPLPPGGAVNSPNQPIGNPLSPVSSVPRPPMPADAGPPPPVPPPGPGAPPPPGPQSLVTAPPPQPSVPPITMPPPQTAAAAPPPAPAASGTIPGAPSPAKIAAAQRLERMYTAAQLTVPPDIAATAKFATAGPLAQLTAAGTSAGNLPSQMALEQFKAQQDAQWKLWVEKNKPVLSRPNTLTTDLQTGRVVGQYEKVGPDGAMHRYLAAPNGQTTDLGQAAITPYATAGGEAAAKRNQVYAETVDKNAATAVVARDQAGDMRQQAPNFYTGPLAKYNQDLNKLLLTLKPTDPELSNKVASYENFIKETGSLARQQVGAITARGGVQELKFVTSSMPSEETSQRGLDRVLGRVQGVADYQVGKQQAMNDYMNQNARAGWDNNGFEAQFNANVSPVTYQFMRMSEADKAETIQRLSGTKEGQADLQRLEAQRKYIVDHNLMPR